MVPQSWFPLFSYIKDRERTTPHPSPPNGGVAVALVVQVDGLVQDWGLFPATDLAAKVLVQCSFSPSGYGFRTLTPAELGGLWDLPISVLDSLPERGAAEMLHALFRTAPTTILFAGADFLSTASFRGGLGGLKQGLGGPCQQGPKQVCLGGLKQGSVGPRPLSDSALGLVRSGSHQDRLVFKVFEPVEVVMGDSQKADNAAVPDQLWLHAFERGYGDLSCLACHRLALNLGSGAAGSLMEKGGPPPGWQAEMPGFRVFGLRFWRRQAVQGYYKWRRSNLPWQSNLGTPAQMVEWRMGMALGFMMQDIKLDEEFAVLKA